MKSWKLKSHNLIDYHKPKSRESNSEPETEPSNKTTPHPKKQNPKLEQQVSMKSSRPLSPLPTNCIEQIYAKEGPLEGIVAHRVLEKDK